ncbi:hypothetical protein AtEden1_Chr1g0039481 [Arabidopsis thaliana]
MEAVTGYVKRKDLGRAVVQTDLGNPKAWEIRLTILTDEVLSENQKLATQKIDPSCAVDVSIGHGASDSPRGSSLAINEVRCECSSGISESDLETRGLAMIIDFIMRVASLERSVMNKRDLRFARVEKRFPKGKTKLKA